MLNKGKLIRSAMNTDNGLVMMIMIRMIRMIMMMMKEYSSDDDDNDDDGEGIVIRMMKEW